MLGIIPKRRGGALDPTKINGLDKANTSGWTEYTDDTDWYYQTLEKAVRSSWADCYFFSKFNGVDEATSATDLSESGVGSPHTITFANDAQIDTGIADVWGNNNGVLKLDGTGDYCSLAQHADFNLGSNEFLVGMWARRNSVGSAQYLYGQYKGASDGIYLSFSATNTVTFQAGNGSWTIDLESVRTITDDGLWHHVAIRRVGNVWDLLVDGYVEATVTNSLTLTDKTSNIAIGIAAWDFSANPFNGWIGDLTVFNGGVESIPRGGPWEQYSKYNVG
jgi:hypothetical protein